MVCLAQPMQILCWSIKRCLCKQAIPCLEWEEWEGQGACELSVSLKSNGASWPMDLLSIHARPLVHWLTHIRLSTLSRIVQFTNLLLGLCCIVADKVLLWGEMQEVLKLAHFVNTSRRMMWFAFLTTSLLWAWRKSTLRLPWMQTAQICHLQNYSRYTYSTHPCQQIWGQFL